MTGPAMLNQCKIWPRMVLKRRTSIEIQDEMIEASDKFKRVCNLEEEIENAKEDLKRAGRTFGLTGEDCGVIAQEVKVLYPWAVTAGTDSYLRVHYGILYEMINVAHSNRNL